MATRPWLERLIASLQRGPRLIRLFPTKASAVADLGHLESFSEAAFRARLTQVYHDVGEAWRERRLTDLEPDVTIDLLDSWAATPPGAPVPMQLGIDAVRATVVEAEAGRTCQHVTISLDGGEPGGVPALQYWTFERGRRGAVQGRTCTGCGAPLVVDLRSRCASCGATIDLGRLAWVLARIESAADWSTRELDPDQDALEALAGIAASDPTFDPDTFTSRVMAVYPHLAQAIRDPSSQLARVLVAPDLRRDLQAMAEARHRRGRRAVLEPVSVSGVAIWSAAHGGSLDSITVDVAGTAASYEVDAAGGLLAGSTDPDVILDRWSFVRPAGVTTSRHGGALAEACPVCGAPIELDEHGRCQHCGAEVTLGIHDWTLAEIGYRDDVGAE